MATSPFSSLENPEFVNIFHLLITTVNEISVKCKDHYQCVYTEGFKFQSLQLCMLKTGPQLAYKNFVMSQNHAFRPAS